MGRRHLSRVALALLVVGATACRDAGPAVAPTETASASMAAAMPTEEPQVADVPQVDLDAVLPDDDTYGHVMWDTYHDTVFTSVRQAEHGVLSLAAFGHRTATLPHLDAVRTGEMLPAPCAPSGALVDRAGRVIGQHGGSDSVRLSEPDRPFGIFRGIVVEFGVGVADDAEGARTVVEAARSCSDTPLSELLPSELVVTEDGAAAQAARDEGADEAVVSTIDAGPIGHQAVTARVGHVVVHVGMTGVGVELADGPTAFARLLVDRARTELRRATGSTGSDEVVDPTDGFVFHVQQRVEDGPSRVLAITGSEGPVEVLLEAPGDVPMAEVAVAPNGQTVAYVLGTYRERHSLHIRQPDGTTVEVVSPAQGTSPRGEPFWPGLGGLAWNSDGSWLAYETEAETSWGEVHLVRADGTGDHLITTPTGAEWTFGDEQPRWGPDPDVLYFQSARTRRGSVWQIGTDGSGARQVSIAPGDDSQVGNATISPDGRWLVAVNLRTQLLVHDLRAGTGVEGPRPGPELNPPRIRPQWAPDSSLVTFTPDGGVGRPTETLVAFDPAAGDATTIPIPAVAVPRHVWLPDSQHLLVDAEEGFAVVTRGGDHVSTIRTEIQDAALLQPTSPTGTPPPAG